MKRLSLAQLSLIAFLVVGGLFTLLYSTLTKSSEMALGQSSQILVDLERTKHQVNAQVKDFFQSGEDMLFEFEETSQSADWLNNLEELEEYLEQSVGSRPNVSEFSFTWDEGQRSVLRNGKTFQKLAQEGPEPAQHRTYTTLVRPQFRSQSIWSDLHFSQLDQETGRAPVVVTVQRAIWLEDELLGVARVGLDIRQLNEIKTLNPVPGWLFLHDKKGALLTQVSDGMQLEEREDAIRYPSLASPPPVQKTLALFRERKSQERDLHLARFSLGGANYLVSSSELEGSQDWMVGTVWDEEHFLKEMRHGQRRALWITALVLLASFLMLVATMSRINKDLYGLVEACQGMQELDFSAPTGECSIKETGLLAQNLEGAKATLRAASKYAPLELIKQLFSQDLEPVLGGETRDLTIMFTDVADFTSVSEQLGTDELARRLGEYLLEMNEAIASQEGSILERVGDALLVIWNAPKPCQNHSLKACRAALATCHTTLENDWVTRIGIHRDEVMVGHFGSEKRMNYGVLGDGVNLASRVEGLNKHYGTRILVTGAVFSDCQDELEFRHLDRVAVKGRQKAVELYELLGEKSSISEETRALKVGYQEAFSCYLVGDFDKAVSLWQELKNRDVASAVLWERARALQASPPTSWDGIFRADFK